MFRIPDFYDIAPNMEFKHAVDIVTRHGRGDLLEGMQALDRAFNEFCEGQRAFYACETDYMVFADEDDFYEHYGVECSAYNVVFKNMGKLFAPKVVV